MPAAGSAAAIGQPLFITSNADAYAPTPKNAAWPKLTSPPRLPSRDHASAMPPIVSDATIMLMR